MVTLFYRTLFACLLAAFIASATHLRAEADLQAIAFTSLSPNPIAPGAHPQSVTFTFANNGPDAFDAVTYELYLSTNKIHGDQGDVKIGEYNDEFWGYLYPGLFEDYTLSASDTAGMPFFTIPTNTPPGNYFVFLRVIPAFYSSQTDTNLANNEVWSSTSISVGVPACSYSITPSTFTAPAGGGYIDVRVNASDTNCAWSVASTNCSWSGNRSSADWISFCIYKPGYGDPCIGSALIYHTGSGRIHITVRPNDTCLPRSCTVTIAGEAFTVNRAAGSGTFSLSSTNWSPSSARQSTNLSVFASSGCNWSVSNPAPAWITVTPTNGTGNGTVTIHVTTNSSGYPRYMTLAIAGQNFFINQAELSCYYNVSATIVRIGPEGGAYPMLVDAPTGCHWGYVNNCEWLLISPTFNTTYPDDPAISIIVSPNPSKTNRSATINIAGQDVTVIQGGQMPGQLSLVTPVEGETVSRFALRFSWLDLDLSHALPTWCRLYVATQNGSKYLDLWLPYSDQDIFGVRVWAEWLPTNTFAFGNYTWWVQSWNSAGLSPWSAAGHFTVAPVLPTTPVLLGPSGQSLSTPAVQYSWAPDVNTAWYELRVSKNGAPFADKWFPASAFTGSNCEQILYSHSSGQYSWWMRGWNPDGMGAWSDTANFTVSLSLPEAVTLLTPSSNSLISAVENINFSWSSDAVADWYCLSLQRNNTNYFSHWLQGTNFLLTNHLPAGNYVWWIQAWNAEGLGPSSIPATFTVPIAGTYYAKPFDVPPKSDPCCRWYTDETTTWFELYINKDGVMFSDQWLPTNALTIVTSGVFQTCLPTGYSAGTYTWWVRGWSPVTGMGPWSAIETLWTPIRHDPPHR